MKIIHSPELMTAWSDRQIESVRRIALVPTMGFFHRGHLALMDMAGDAADQLVVSLFVNPLQFGPNEDLAGYPRDFAKDADLARQHGVDVLFAPTAKEMYPEESLSVVHQKQLPERLCGACRPGHFDGVCTVVTKLFHIVKPRLAVFGKKDFQQLAIIRRMVSDLNFDVEIKAHPIVREPDGLALSSRNSYLSAEERKTARCLYESLRLAVKYTGEGLSDVAKLLRIVEHKLAAFPVQLDYLAVVDQRTLLPQMEIDRHSRLLLAVWVGGTRLIDNARLVDLD